MILCIVLQRTNGFNPAISEGTVTECVIIYFAHRKVYCTKLNVALNKQNKQQKTFFIFENYWYIKKFIYYCRNFKIWKYATSIFSGC